MNTAYRQHTCNCHSYNWEIGTEPERVVPKPDWLHKQGDTVSLDACIADLVLELWDNGVRTLSSCCGHNRAPASIVLSDNEENYSDIHQLIVDLDGRYVELSQWRRVIV